MNLLPLASLRARGDVVEFREADLRFSLEETASFLREEMRLQVDDQTVSDLKNYTEGWVAGFGIVVYAVFGLSELGVHVVGEIPAGLAPPKLPNITLDQLRRRSAASTDQEDRC